MIRTRSRSLLFLALLPMGALLYAVDSEEAVMNEWSISRVFEEVKGQVTRNHKLRTDEKLRMLTKFSNKFPDTTQGAEADYLAYELAYKAKPRMHEEVYARMERLYRLHPTCRWAMSKARMSFSLWVVAKPQKGVTEEVRIRGCKLLLKYENSYHARVANALHQIKGISTKEKCQMIKAALERNGDTVDREGALCKLMQQHAAHLAKTDLPKAIKVCKSYLAYIGDSPWWESEMKRTMAQYQLKQGGAVKTEATQTIADAKAYQDKVKSKIDEIGDVAASKMASRDYRGATKEIRKLQQFRNCPWWIMHSILGKLYTAVKATPIQARMKLASAGVEVGLKNQLQNLWSCFDSEKHHLQVKPMLIAAFSKHGADDYRKFLYTSPIHMRHYSPSKRASFYEIGAFYLAQNDLSDRAAEYYFNAATSMWDSNKDLAVRYFKKAMEVSPKSPRGVAAWWVLDRLTGKEPLAVSAKARFTPDMLSETAEPEVKLPQAPRINRTVVKQGENYTLVKNRGQAKIDQKRLAASDNLDAAKLACDGNAETVWAPASLPGAFIAPLVQVSTINEIRIHGSDQLNYTVSLLGSDGRILRRYSRCNIDKRTKHAVTRGPSGEQRIIILPCDDVAYMKVTIYDRAKDADGIREMSALSPSYPLLGIKPLKFKPVPSGRKSIALRWNADEPEHLLDLDDKREHVHYVGRSNAWKRTHNHWQNRMALEFYGDVELSLELSGRGKMLWHIDHKDKGAIMLGREKLHRGKVFQIERVEPGWHVFAFRKTALPGPPNEADIGWPYFLKFKLKGKARGYYAVRFRRSGGKWGEWRRGKRITIPSGAKEYQLAAVLDSRSVNGMAAAKLGPVKITHSDKVGDDIPVVSPRPSFLQDKTAELARFIMEERPVIAYSKAGTRGEYEAIKALAEKAGCYLISDDIGLNQHTDKLPMVSIGTPLINRHCRGLRSKLLVWGDGAFLNSEKGIALTTVDALDPSSDLAVITGETPEAVVNAVKRVTAQVLAIAPSSTYRVFNLSMLERLYPWQLHSQDPPAGKVALTMSQRSRRTVKAGIAFDKEVRDLAVTCTQLRGPGGATLPAPRVRYTGFFEWILFFGDVHIPDMLVDRPNLPIPANSSLCFFLTTETEATTKPGTYRGTVTIMADGRRKSLPFELSVLPIKLDPITRINTFSYSSMPVWFHSGSELYETGRRNLIENEAIHGLSMIGVEPSTVKYRSSGGKWKFDFSDTDNEIAMIDSIYRKHNRVPPFLFMYTHAARLRLVGDRPKDVTGHGSFELAWAKQLTAHLKRSGNYDRFWAKVGDEPHSFDQWVKMAKPFKEGGLRVFTAHNARQSMNVAFPYMDAFCIDYRHDLFFKPMRDELKKGKHQMWWYMCGTPRTRMTGDLCSNLPMYWLTAKWNFQGVHSYAALFTTESRNPMPFRYDHGSDQRMQMWPDGSIVDSIRRELEAEGIRDCILLYWVKDRINKLPASKRAGAQKELDDIFESVVSYRYRYSHDFAVWEKARERVFKLAMKIR